MQRLPGPSKGTEPGEKPSGVLNNSSTGGSDGALKLRMGFRLPLTDPQNPELDWTKGGHSTHADH